MEGDSLLMLSFGGKKEGQLIFVGSMDEAHESRRKDM